MLLLSGWLAKQDGLLEASWQPTPTSGAWGVEIVEPLPDHARRWLLGLAAANPPL